MDRRVVRTREAIRNAYIELLTESSDGKVSITDIAKRANIDRKTFYLHFESTDAMVRNFGEERIAEVYRYLNERSFFEHPYDKDMIFNALSALIEKDEKFYRSLAVKDGSTVFWTEIENALVKIISETYIGEGMYSKEELVMLGKFFTTGTISIYKSWLKGEIDCSLDELSAIASEMSFRGIQGIIRVGKERLKNKK